MSGKKFFCKMDYAEQYSYVVETNELWHIKVLEWLDKSEIEYTKTTDLDPVTFEPRMVLEIHKGVDVTAFQLKWGKYFD